MIKKVYSNRNRPGWKYDAAKRKHYSWHFDIRLADGRRKKESGFLSKADVEAAVARIRLLEKEMKYGFVTQPKDIPNLEEICRKKLDLTPNRHELARATRVLHIFCDEAQVKRATDVQSAHMQKFVDRRRKDGVSPQSINRELNIISAALHSAVIHFTALENWVVPRIPRPKHSKRRRERVITSDEVTRVLNWLYTPRRVGETSQRAANRRTVGHVFRFALLTGARKGEICGLRWDYIDWQAGVLQVVGTKTQNRSEQTVRYLKITNTLAEILNERKARSVGDFVFTLAGGEVTHYYEILTEACRVTGVPYGRARAGGLVTHDARHTAVTRMLQGGQDLATIGSITGQSDRTMILHYGHASQESRDRAMTVLDDFAGTQALGLRLDSVPKKPRLFTIIKENSEGFGAEGGTRTPTSCLTRPSTVRVCQFRHFG